MSKKKNEIKFIVLLVALSMVLYVVHYLIFRDWHHLALFALEDLAFVPIDVIFVYLILHRVLDSNEKKKKLSKLYMVIEIFFSVVGTDLLRVFASNDEGMSQIENDLSITPEWGEPEFRQLLKIKSQYQPVVSYDSSYMSKIKEMLQRSRPHLLSLLENQSLLEHETFTELLMAVFHLAEELRYRDDLDNISKADMEHIVVDAKRAYIMLGIEWVDYISHMRIHYPYLYSMAIRTNPFNKKQCVTFED